MHFQFFVGQLDEFVAEKLLETGGSYWEEKYKRVVE
jgi:hypothetical protein